MKTRKVACLCIALTVIALGLVSVYKVGATDGATIRISGTGGDDSIYINEGGNFILLNGVHVEPAGYDGTLTYVYEINAGKGDDVVNIYGYEGNDVYYVYAGQGDDTVNANDGFGDEVFVIEGGQGIDNVDIEDFLGNDQYTVKLGKGADSLVVWDHILSTDNYVLDGGQESDSLTLHGLLKGPPPSEGEGGKISIVGFESIAEYP